MVDVICRCCGGRFHEVVDKDLLVNGNLSYCQQRYKEDVPANGAMFRLKQEYRDASWTSFIETADTVFNNLKCPNCNSVYTEDAGKKVMLSERMPPIRDSICPICKEAFSAGLNFERHVNSKAHQPVMSFFEKLFGWIQYSYMELEEAGL